jgi:hypothetical protein
MDDVKRLFQGCGFVEDLLYTLMGSQGPRKEVCRRENI